MASQLGRAIGLASWLVAALGCTQTPPKLEPPQVDLAEVYKLAADAYDEKDWATSEKHYLTLSRKAPEEAEPWFKLGNIAARTNRPELAIQFYRETLVRDSQHVKAWHNVAVIQLRTAGKSFAELEILVKPDNPLHAKSVRIQKAINELVN